MILQKKAYKFTEIASVEPLIELKKKRSGMVLYATLSGNKIKIPKSEYTKTMTSDSVTITGKDRNLSGTTK